MISCSHCVIIMPVIEYDPNDSFIIYKNLLKASENFLRGNPTVPPLPHEIIRNLFVTWCKSVTILYDIKKNGDAYADLMKIASYMIAVSEDGTISFPQNNIIDTFRLEHPDMEHVEDYKLHLILQSAIHDHEALSQMETMLRVTAHVAGFFYDNLES